MIELNREYSYGEICGCLGWKATGGDSKRAQIKEIEDSFEFYHPMNSKTRKEKKNYVFTKQLKEPVQPSRRNNGGANNTKNVEPMLRYMMSFLLPDALDHWYAYGTWLCEKLRLLDYTTLNASYDLNKEVKVFCAENGIKRTSVLLKYTAYARSIAKELFDGTMDYAQRKGVCDFERGYTLVVAGRLDKEVRIPTTALNDVLPEIETEVCNELNAKFDLGNFTGLQNKLPLSQNAEYWHEFQGRVVDALNDNSIALDLLEAKVKPRKYDEYVISSYYKVVRIKRLAHTDENPDQYAAKVIQIIREKTRATLYGLTYTDNSGCPYHPYDENDDEDVERVEKMLYEGQLGIATQKPDYIDDDPDAMVFFCNLPGSRLTPDEEALFDPKRRMFFA